MRIAEINMIASGSTGKIMLDIANVARSRGHEVLTFSTNVFSKRYKRLKKAHEGHKYYGCYLDHGLHYILSKRFGKNGTHSKLSTLCLIRKLKKFKPDIVHLHNLHKYCINFDILTRYLKKSGVKVFMTLHDCWTFTGHCPHFDYKNCEKWKTGCYNCSSLCDYPAEKKDTSKFMYEKKKEWFLSLNDLTLIAPSDWTKSMAGQSFFKDTPIEVIKTGIDLSVFKPTDSDFRKVYGLEDKFIVLGVADYWGEKKGLSDFIELSKTLDDRFKVVLVGTDEETEKLLPQNVLSIHRTQNQTQLAEIYSVADVFVNPTKEEVLGLVNIEALACGTPVITYNTGGSPETVDKNCGIVVDKGDVTALENAVIRVCEDKPFAKEDCINRAKQFDKDQKFLEYVRLYEKE